MADGTHVILDAVASKTVQTLVESYGFDLERSVEAVQVLGASCQGDVGLAVEWLIEHGEEDTGGAVQFTHCPHLNQSAPIPAGSPSQRDGKQKAVPLADEGCCRQLVQPSQLVFGLPCARGCASKENWLCLECGVTSCGRYVNKHAVAHHQETGHTPSVSLADMSVWCYLCDGYVQHPRLNPLVERLQHLKFGSNDDDKGGGSGGGGGGSSSTSPPRRQRRPSMDRIAEEAEAVGGATTTTSSSSSGGVVLNFAPVAGGRGVRLSICRAGPAHASGKPPAPKEAATEELLTERMDSLSCGGSASASASMAVDIADGPSAPSGGSSKGGGWEVFNAPPPSSPSPSHATPVAPAAVPASMPPPPPRSEMDALVEALARAPPRSVVVMVGAGMSVSAGIPDFRSPGTGLYDNLQAYGLPYPEAVFDISYFPHHPEPFYRLCRELWPGNFDPTPAHRFLTRLHAEGKLLRCFTQNIDSLESAAGLPADMVVAAHGNFDAAHVAGQPHIEVPVAELREAIMEGAHDESLTAVYALRDKYGGLVKPAITFFGEDLPQRFTERLPDLKQCQVLLIFGTSLKVQPFASLVRLVRAGTPRALLNRDKVGVDLGLDFDGDDEEKRDVFIPGDCDDAARELCRRLGWGEL